MRTKIIIAFLLLPFVLLAQDKTKLIDQYINSQASLNDFSGNVLIAHKGKVIYKKALGFANREWNIPNNIETKFRIGSITKQFTSAAILQLVEKGKLSLDDKLSKFFPDFPKADSVTIHMLLNHTSGIRSYTDIKNFRLIAPLPYAKDSVIALVSRESYDFSPGTKYTYSNSGYFILGYIIEKVSGQSYSNYIDNMVKKIGLKNTGVDRLDSIMPNRAYGYVTSPNGYKNAPFISMEFPFSAGAIFSTVDEIYQWQKALFSGKVVSESLLKKMTTAYLNKYGYGLHLDTLHKHPFVGHTGAITGFNSSSEYYPADDLYIIVFTNNTAGESPNIQKALASIMFNLPVVMPYEHKEVKIDHNIIDKYAGRYMVSDGTIINLVKKNNKLYRRTEGGVEFEFKAESPTKFFAINGRDNQVEFTVDQNGNVVKAELIRSGVKMEMKKVAGDTVMN